MPTSHHEKTKVDILDLAQYACVSPEATNCMPMQNEMTYLCEAMAKSRIQTDEVFLARPTAIPSNTACRERARITKNPRRAA